MVFAFADMAFRISAFVAWVGLGFVARVASGKYPDLSFQCEMQAVASQMLYKSGLRGLPKDTSARLVPVFFLTGLLFVWCVTPTL